MKLKSIELQNVRIFTDKKIECAGGIDIFRAPNKGGKTTLADAVSFVLTGKLYGGSTNPESLKPIHDTKLPVSITLEFVRRDGIIAQFKKVYQENWVRTRGTTDVTLSGHVTDCFVNGIKKNLKDYEKELIEYFDCQSIQDIQVMTNAYFFSQVLPWKDRLAYVNRIIDPTTAEDVYQAEPVTRNLDGMLRSHNYHFQNLRKYLATAINQGKESQAKYEAMIVGIQVTTNITSQEYQQARTGIAKNNEQIIILRTKKNGLKNPVVEALKTTLNGLRAALSDSIAKDQASVQKNAQAINDQIQIKRQEANAVMDNRLKMDESIREIQRQINDLQTKQSADERLLVSKNTEIKMKKDEWYKEDAKVFTPSEVHRCPQCGFDLQGTEAANQTAKEHFNIEKAARLEAISNQGKHIKNEIEEINKRLAGYGPMIAEKKEKLVAEQTNSDALYRKYEAIQDEILKLKMKVSYNVEDSAETASLRSKLKETEAEITKEESSPIEAAEIDSDIAKLMQDNEEHDKVVTSYNVQQTLLERKKSYQVELDKIVSSLADDETSMSLLTRYTETMLNIITSKVKAKFGDINIRLVEQNLKEGSWNEVCYVMIETPNGLVPYETANTESKVKVGVKLASLLSEHLGWQAGPIVIDNLESVTENNRNFLVPNQIIGLVASDIEAGL